jgi:hypothetical protein
MKLNVGRPNVVRPAAIKIIFKWLYDELHDQIVICGDKSVFVGDDDNQAVIWCDNETEITAKDNKEKKIEVDIHDPKCFEKLGLLLSWAKIQTPSSM